MMKIKILILNFRATQEVAEDTLKLRGFFATRFSEYMLLHQHTDDNKLIYRYPLVQYKIINKEPMILGINDGVEVLKKIYDQYSEIKLGNSVYEIVEKSITIKEQEFGISTDKQNYKFLTPYLALNQKNYEKYIKAKRKEQTEMLNKILIGNILSIAKSLEYVVLDEIKVNTKLRQVRTKLKDIPFTGFLGEFEVNFLLPDYIGLGKSVSRGFGTIVRI